MGDRYNLVDENENNKNSSNKLSNGDTYFDDRGTLRTNKEWGWDSALSKPEDFDAGFTSYLQRAYPGEKLTDEQQRQLREELNRRGGLSNIYSSNRMSNYGAPNAEAWFKARGFDPYESGGASNKTVIVNQASMGNPTSNTNAPKDNSAANANSSAANSSNTSGFDADEILEKNTKTAKKGLEESSKVDPEFLDNAETQAKDVNDRYKAFVDDIKEYWRKSLVLDLLGAGAGKDGEWSIKDRWTSVDKEGKRRFDGKKFARNMHYLLNAIGTVAQSYGAALQGRDPSVYQADYVKDQNKMVNAYLDRINKVHDAGANAANLIGKQAESNQGFANRPRNVSAEAYGLIMKSGASITAKRAILSELTKMGQDVSNLGQKDWDDITKAMLMTAENPDQAATAILKGIGGKATKAIGDWAKRQGFNNVQDFFNWLGTGNVSK